MGTPIQGMYDVVRSAWWKLKWQIIVGKSSDGSNSSSSLCFLEGYVNRGDLMDAFGISVNQASTDLNHHISMAPDNIAQHKSARTYIRGIEFEPLLLKPDARRYLFQLRSVADDILDRADAWIGLFPSYDAAPIPVRGVNAKTQCSVVALDYGVRRGKAQIRVRRALLCFALWRLAFDTDPEARQPQNQQFVLLNREIIHEDCG